MRRIISTVLTFAMLLTFIPANVFAAEGEAFTLDFGTYDKSTAFNNSGRYYLSSTTVGTNWAVDTANTTNKAYYGATTSACRLQSNITIGNRTDSSGKNAALAFKFTAPATGVYDVSTDIGVYRAGALGDVHLIDGSKKIYLGSFDTFEKDLATVRRETRNLLSVSLEEGKEYSISFTAVRGSHSQSTTLYPYTVSFTPTDTPATIVLDAAADRTALAVGDSANISISTALSNGGGYDFTTIGETVSYRSSDESIVTVTDSGIITGVSKGDATITATVNIGGTEYTDIIEVSIGHTFSVDFLSVDRESQVHPSNITSDQSFSNKNTHGDNWIIDTANSAAKHYDGTTSSVRIQSNYAYIKKHGPFVINFTVEKGGKYDIAATVWQYSSCGTSDFYIDGTYIGTINMNGANLEAKEVKLIGAELSQGTHSFAIVPVDGYAFIRKFDFTVVEELSSANISATVDSYVMNPEETRSINVSALASNGAAFDIDKAFTTISDKAVASNGNAVTYSGYDETVVSVSNAGVITALSEGKSEITVSAILGGLKKTAKVSVSVEKKAPGEAIENTTVKFGAFADEGGTVTDKNIVKDVPIGGSVTVEATPDEGYEFAYWRNASGKHLSSEAKETFTVNTNTSVIAVFDKVAVSEEDTTVPVYFYNENGSLIEKKDVEKGTTFESVSNGIEKSLTGFIFREWSISKETIVNSILRAVALYDADTTKYTVKAGNEEIKGVYGQPVTVHGSENFKAWKLGDNIVSYDKDYSFYIWGDITLEEVTEGENEIAPTVAINKIGDNYFIAYNVPEGYTLIEAGIVFAEKGVPEIGSFYSKAVAKEGTGQFTAKKGDGKETVARGYLMFRDSDGIRVIYAD